MNCNIAHALRLGNCTYIGIHLVSRKIRPYKMICTRSGHRTLVIITLDDHTKCSDKIKDEHNYEKMSHCTFCNRELAVNVTR